MKYSVNQALRTRATRGLDLPVGDIYVTGASIYRNVPDWASEPFLQGLEFAEAQSLRDQVWYAFEFIAADLHSDYGTMWLPEELFTDALVVGVGTKFTCSIPAGLL